MASPSRPPVDQDEDEEVMGLFERMPWLKYVLIPLVAAGGYFAFAGKSSNSAKTPPPRPAERMVAIAMPPPPPPRPPPPPSPNPPEPETKVEPEKMEEVTPEEEPPPAPEVVDEPPPISTGLVGPGPGLAGLGSGPSGGSGNGRGIGGSRSGGSKFGYYGSQVGKSLTAAVNREVSLKKLKTVNEVRIWVDGAGRITRARLSGSTGSAAADDVLINQVITGYQLPGPPPEGMKMPIVIRFSARAAGSVATR